MNYQLIFLLFIFFFFSCKENSVSTNYEKLPAITEKGINVVVEIPAGTNHKIEYQKDKKRFENDKIDGKTRIIQFLPYPGNYGFIPSTLMDEERGGDGDALDILVIGESQPTGTVQEVIPIGVLLLKDKGEIDSKIVAVPTNANQQVIAATDFKTFLIEYDAAKRIIEDWFLNYKGYGVMELIGWRDEAYAMEEVRKWMVEVE